jgi:uncharacterized protein (DUF2236 family)
MAYASTDSSVGRRINAERLVLLGWGRAILMQLAHPLVAAGVDEHSTFREHSWSAASRLHHTVRAMLALTFGGAAAHERAIQGILTIHRRVNGTLKTAVGRFPAGTRYSAEDPELVLWVHATLLESLPLVYDMLVEPLHQAERDAYCEESAPVAVALGARGEDVPRRWTDVAAYLAHQYSSGAIEVGAQARALADAVLSPPFARVLGPAGGINRLVTIGLLPPQVRAQYGYRWEERDRRAFDRYVRLLRRIRRVTPAPLALWPEARRRPD